ncbi:MAG: hypothetical protein KC561_10285, partial [Myxococcales bacterium]|nr:hypothetical protein [Myxococcales bacterium]
YRDALTAFSGETEPCATSAMVGYDRLAEDLLREISDAKASSFLYALAADGGRSLEAVEANYASCLGATPIELSESALSGERWVSARYAVEAMGSVHFQNQRVRRPGVTEGGEFRLGALVDLQLFLPARPAGEQASTRRPSAALIGQFARLQTFRDEELSRFTGNAFLRTRLPIGCSAVTYCQLQTTAWARSSIGDDDEFPLRLVAPHWRFGASTSFAVPTGAWTTSLTGTYQGLEYTDEFLDPADRHEFLGEFRLDGPALLHIAALDVRYPTAGAVFRAADPDRSNREFTLLTIKAGTVLAIPGLQQIRFRLLGGAALPVRSSLTAELDPALVFDFEVEMGQGRDQSGFTFYTESHNSIEPAAGDAVLQSHASVTAGLNFSYPDPPDRGVRAAAEIFYDAVSYDALLNSDSDPADPDRLGGRAIFEWLWPGGWGVYVSNTTSAYSQFGGARRVTNHFLIGLFATQGGYGFGLEEDEPW